LIIAIDIESAGLDATKFIMGCLMKQGCKKPEFFYSKEALWKRVLALGKAESKRGKVLNVYSHNAQYDFYAYADLKDKHLKFYSDRPFIVAYQDDFKRESIMFLDTMSIFRMSLKRLGDMIGLEKMEMPNELMQDSVDVTDELKKKMEIYCKRDTDICLKSILDIKEKMKNNGVIVRRLYTINQIAINYLINEWRKMEDMDWLFWDKQRGQMRRTFRADEIHGAYRGGKVDCYKLGMTKHANYVDFNSLYPYSATKMRIPNLMTERMFWRPLERMTQNEMLNKIGVTRVLMKNESNDLGLLAVRTTTSSFFPKSGTHIIGTYTNYEIREALKEGYKLINAEWTVNYDEINVNPFKTVFNKLYSLRGDDSSLFESYFYKMLMNGSIGKLAQTKVRQEIIIDSVEKADEYLERNYKIIKGIDLNYMYQLTDDTSDRKRYYVPILPTLINAHARILMYREMKKIPLKDLIYTDTDSIIFKGDHFNKFKIGKKMGEFKIVNKDVPIKLYGKKTYAIGDEIRISGIKRNFVGHGDFEKGIVSDLKMKTLKTTNDINEVGKFKKETRDLNKQQDDYEKNIKLLKDEKLLLDCNIRDISFFIKDIEKFKYS